MRLRHSSKRPMPAKRTGFAGCGKTHGGAQAASGLNFSRADNAPESARALEAAERLIAWSKKRQAKTSQLGEKLGSLKGHEVTRAARATESARPLGPEGWFQQNRSQIWPFSPSCSVVPIMPGIGARFGGRGKTHCVEQEASGHDFSRAERATITRGFNPCQMFLRPRRPNPGLLPQPV